MADWNQPTNASAYTGVLTTLNEKVANSAKMDYTGDTNLPTGIKRHDSSTNRFQEWNGSTWVDITINFATDVDMARSVNGQHRLRVYNDSTGASATTVIQLGNNENIAAGGITLYGTNNTSGGNAGGVSFIVGTARALAFGTNGSEEMRIDSVGRFLVGKTEVAPGAAGVHFDTTAHGTPIGINKTNTGVVSAIICSHNGTAVGGVNYDDTSTSFPTSSDYRLKENVVNLTGAIDRIKQASARRFNFITKPGETIDGFIAHELAVAVPNAVFGEKDAVDGEGNIIFQSVDYSKVTPLLWAAIVELDARLSALEG